MKRMLRIFVLSKNEQRVVLIIILALIVGALVGYERRAHQLPVQATAAMEQMPSPSPQETEGEQ